MPKTNPNSNAALEVSDQAEYYRTAPITEVAAHLGISIDEAADMRVAAALASAPPRLDVTVRPIEPNKNQIGWATLKFNDCFVVEDFKVLTSDRGIFVGSPSRPDKKSETGYRDTAKPITKEFYAMLTEAVTAEYHKAVERLKTRAAADPEKKTGMTERMAEGAKQAAEHNAALPQKGKGAKDVNVDL